MSSNVSMSMRRLLFKQLTTAGFVSMYILSFSRYQCEKFRNSLVVGICQNQILRHLMLYVFFILRGCLVRYFGLQFSVFKQHYTYFHALFHPRVFLKNTNNVTKITLPKDPKVFGEPLYFLHLLMKLKVSLQSYGHIAEVMLSFLQGFSQCCFSCSTQSGITVAYQLTLYGESVWIIAFGWWNCL